MSTEKDNNSTRISRRDAIKATSAIAASAISTKFAAASAVAAEDKQSGSSQMTVIQYVLSRLKELGVKHTFGVPGDFVYDVCDGIEDDPDIKGIWCANELNAGYAADGYARTNGMGVAVFTMAAELSPFQSIGTANSDSSRVLHITGLPSPDEMASGGRLHHMIVGMEKDNHDMFHKMIAPLTAGGNSVAIITPENCIAETERLLAAMLYHSKPAAMAIPRLVAKMPVVVPKGELNTPLANPQSDPQALDAAVREIIRRIESSKRPVWLPGFVIRRYNCVAETKALIEASGLPFFTGLQDMAVLSEQHPQFGGHYLGRWTGTADDDVSNFIEKSDCIVAIGPENHSFNNAFHTVKDELGDTVNIMPHETRIGFSIYRNIEMKDVLSELGKRIKRRTTDVAVPAFKSWVGGQITGNGNDAITYDPFYQRLQAFYRPDDIIVGCTSLCVVTGLSRMRKPEGADMEASMAFGMLGWGTAALLGNAVAAQGRRCVLLTGEGAHQMTANELGTYGRYGLKPVFIVVNNNGYGAERVTNRYPDESYNDVAQWNYADLPGVMGCKDWFTKKVSTLGELDAALAEASKADTGVYIEVIIDKDIQPIGADWLFSATGAYFGLAGRTWEDWLREGRKLKL